MAKRVERIEFIAELKFDIDNAKQSIESLRQRLQNISSDTLGMGEGRKKKAGQLLDKLDVLSQKDMSKMTQEEQKMHLRELTRLQNEYNKLVNGALNSAARTLALDERIVDKAKEHLDAIQSITEQYQHNEKSITSWLSQLDKIDAKTLEIKNNLEASVDKTFNKRTGLSKADLMDEKKVEKAMNDPQLSAAKKKALEEHLNILKATNKELEKNKKKSDDILNKVQETTNKQKQLRDQKEESLKKIVEIARQEGLIDENGERRILQLQQENDQREQIVETTKEQVAADKKSGIDKNIKDTNELGKSNEKVAKSFSRKVLAATAYYAAIRALRRLMSSVINTVRDLDKSLTEVAMVTQMTRKEAWELVDAYQNLATEVGTTTDEIAKLSVYFFRQGRTAKDALELTKVAAIAAKVASIDATESANFLTSAINGFGMAADQALEVSDKFAALAASSASSYQELAIALSKVAPSANMAGVSIDFMMGVIAKGVETTREAPENIGTAFKTIFARMMQIREFGATLDDATGVNKVEQALAQAEVSLRDSTGTFRDMDVVLDELGRKWDTLTRNEQSYIATALAGTRQQTRLLAVMQDYQRTVELVEISQNSLGATLAQQAEYSGGMQAATARLNTAWQKLILTFSNTDTIIKLINGLTKIVDTLGSEIERNGPLIIGVMAAIGVAVLALVVKFGLLSAAVTAATGGLNWIIPAVIAAGAAVYAFAREGASDIEKFKDNVADLNKEIEENQVTLYNYRKGKAEVSGLIDEYRKLENQVVKSTEEVERMEELLSKIDSFSKDSEYDLVVNGVLNEDADLFLQFYDSEIKKAQSETITLGRDMIVQYSEGLQDEDKAFTPTGASKMAMVDYIAQQITGGIDYFDLEREEQENIQNLILANFDNYVAKFADRMDSIGKKTEQIDMYESLIGKGFWAPTGMTDWAYDIPREMIGQFRMQVQQRLLDEGERQQATIGGDLFNQYWDELMQSYIDEAERAAAGIEGGTFDTFERINQTTLDLIDNIKEDLKNNYSGDSDLLWSEFLGLPNAQEIARSIPQLAQLLSFGLTQATNIARADIKKGQDDVLSTIDKFSIIRSMQEAGMSTLGISTFFDNTDTFDVEAITNLLEDLGETGRFASETIANLGQNLFDVFTNSKTSGGFMDEIERAKNTTNTILELQEKLKSGQGLTSEEFGQVQSLLGTSGLLDDFFAGTLEAGFNQESLNGIKAKMQEALNAIVAELAIEGNENDQLLINERDSLEFLINNIDDVFTSNTMDEYYQSQINYIKQLNQNLQQQINLEQQKIDMNRSMLSVNRQIRALERDTSFGAQARLEELQMTREREAMNRQAFMMDMVANQQIQQLENQNVSSQRRSSH